MSFKHSLYRLFGKDPDAVVVSFLSGPAPLGVRMVEEIRGLVPHLEHFAVTLDSEPLEIPGIACLRLSELPGPLRRKRIGLAPVLYSQDPKYRRLRRAAWIRAPHKILAYNERLERHHLMLGSLIASWLFVRGVPLDRIFLRPKWLVPWKRDRSVFPEDAGIHNGRPLSPGRPRVAVVTPYFPYPLSHGGAVRIFHLLREAARDFDVFLFSFAEKGNPEEMGPILELCATVVTVPNARYREPRWSSIDPPEVAEFRSSAMRRLLAQFKREFAIDVVQVEYTQMASYGGDVLVEHDVTFDLYRQIHEKERSLASWWNYKRWLWYERRVTSRFRKIVVMSEKDAALLPSASSCVIPNGVDLKRFRPLPETGAARLLFVGSFRHFPNIVAYRFFTEEVWPLLRNRVPGISLTAVAGPDPALYWTAPSEPFIDDAIEFHGFIRDVLPLYADANVVIVPTKVSAGTNLKVLEAMAMGRAVVSTSSGCAGLGLEHGVSVWVADTAADFALGIERLLMDPELRMRMSRAARAVAEALFDWEALGLVQREIWNTLLPENAVHVRPGSAADLNEVERIQASSHLAGQWDFESYLRYDLQVAEFGGRVAGFSVSRTIDDGEVELLNIAVDPQFRRRGIAVRLLRNIRANRLILEVRESNDAARTLYKKLGFEEIGRRERYYDDPEETAIVMRLSR